MFMLATAFACHLARVCMLQGLATRSHLLANGGVHAACKSRSRGDKKECVKKAQDLDAVKIVLPQETLFCKRDGKGCLLDREKGSFVGKKHVTSLGITNKQKCKKRKQN